MHSTYNTATQTDPPHPSQTWAPPQGSGSLVLPRLSESHATVQRGYLQFLFPLHEPTRRSLPFNCPCSPSRSLAAQHPSTPRNIGHFRRALLRVRGITTRRDFAGSSRQSHPRLHFPQGSWNLCRQSLRGFPFIWWKFLVWWHLSFMERSGYIEEKRVCNFELFI